MTLIEFATENDLCLRIDQFPAMKQCQFAVSFPKVCFYPQPNQDAEWFQHTGIGPTLDEAKADLCSAIANCWMELTRNSNSMFIRVPSDLKN